MKEQVFVRKLETFELEQLLNAYNTICQIIKDNDDNRQHNQMYIDAIISNQYVLNEIIMRQNNHKD